MSRPFEQPEVSRATTHWASVQVDETRFCAHVTSETSIRFSPKTQRAGFAHFDAS